MERVTRFAPSPTGHLHLGHAYSALFAEAQGTRFLVRIEDIDTARCRPEFDEAILDDLAWLGLAWETPVRRQSAHMDDYAGALNALAARDLLYPCFCTRKDIQAEITAAGYAPHSPDGLIYPGICRNLSSAERNERLATGAPHALRLKMDKAIAVTATLTWHDAEAGLQQARPEIFGDVVLARKDTPASYHLAVTVDDHLQGVTIVTRGQDLFEASHVHRLLQALLGYEAPAYNHHKLLTDAQGKRFAKRDKAQTLKSLRAAGHTPADVRAMVGWEA